MRSGPTDHDEARPTAVIRCGQRSAGPGRGGGRTRGGLVRGGAGRRGSGRVRSSSCRDGRRGAGGGGCCATPRRAGSRRSGGCCGCRRRCRSCGTRRCGARTIRSPSVACHNTTVLTQNAQTNTWGPRAQHSGGEAQDRHDPPPVQPHELQERRRSRTRRPSTCWLAGSRNRRSGCTGSCVGAVSGRRRACRRRRGGDGACSPTTDPFCRASVPSGASDELHRGSTRNERCENSGGTRRRCRSSARRTSSQRRRPPRSTRRPRARRGMPGG